jgi:hypothetical protein
MAVVDIFRFGDGRTVFVGKIDEGDDAIVLPGKGDLIIGERKIEVELQSEMIDNSERRSDGLRAVATTDPLSIPKNVTPSKLVLKGKMRMRGHRDLIGIESPPREFVPDRMTLGPRLPDGWDGDAWTSPDEARFFLRAWNKAIARYAIGTGGRYEEARANLLDELNKGGRRVEIAANVGT